MSEDASKECVDGVLGAKRRAGNNIFPLFVADVMSVE